MKKETWTIIGIVGGSILTGLGILFSSLGWLNFWITGSIGIFAFLLSCGLLIFFLLKKPLASQLEETYQMTTFEEGRRMIEKDADDPKYAVKIAQDKNYTEMDLSIGEGGSTQAHYLKTKMNDEGLFYHELVDREPIKDNKGNPIKDKNGNYSYRKAIKITKFDPDDDSDTKRLVDEWIRIFAVKPTRKIVTTKPIVSPIGTIIGTETQEKELAEVEEELEKKKEEKEGEV